jgi:flavin-dependent dehydrogenase
MTADRQDLLIIGGGLAGAGAAVQIARAGRPVLLVEREVGPHDKVCGEFLSPEAARYLAALGLDLAALGAEPIEGLRIAAGGTLAGTRLPFRAASLSRRALDEALLAHAAAAGATVLRGRRVAALERDGPGWRARLQDGETIAARAVFLACGKHDLRGWRRPAGLQGDLIAFKQHFRLAPDQARALRRHVELILFRGGYAGLEPVEGGAANLCLVVRRRRFEALGQDWPSLRSALLAEQPHLAHRLAGAEPLADRPLALAAIPYGHLAWRAPGSRQAARPWLLGDQAAVIPSFAGEGMSIALHSARLAAEHFLAGHGAGAYQRRLARDLAPSLYLATALSLLLVRERPQALAALAARHLPALIATVARATRLPEAALAGLAASR